ncbi:hypothetical protein [Photobacterium leiognathi]|uniref:hypothetical protein n=1 Tax=Photobacterium leiognathi TaxID=553611 RepID=UPI0029823078|nr:hypothetical protein [Photobacterium leiognathi]
MDALNFTKSLIGNGISNVKDTILSSHPSISEKSVSLNELNNMLVDNNIRVENDMRHSFLIDVLEKHSLHGLTERPLELEQNQLTETVDNEMVMDQEIDNSPSMDM